MQKPYFDFQRLDLIVRQGEDFRLFYKQKDDEGQVMNLAGATIEMQCRKSALSERLFLWIKGNAVTGGTLGSREFFIGGGSTPGGTFEYGGSPVLGGGFVLNATENGGTGQTGGVYLHIPREATRSMPVGVYYNFQIDLRLPGTTQGTIVSRYGSLAVTPGSIR
jgi:hypothetical protein